MRRLVLLAAVTLSLSCTPFRTDEPSLEPRSGGRRPNSTSCHVISRSRCDSQCGGVSADLVTYQCRDGTRYTRCVMNTGCQ